MPEFENDDSNVVDAYQNAKTAFDQDPDEVEDGLDVDSASALQLRKACRLLEAIRKLEGINGDYTIIIEASFAAIERSIQHYLYDRDVLDEDDFLQDHTRIYEEAAQTGLISDDLKQALTDLWKTNRSKTYYRDGIASYSRAEKMHELAKALHTHTTDQSSEGHLCICSDT